MNRKVSVIIPMYNVEAYIEKCIASIKDQTYANWEVIAVDDGSLDTTYEKAEKYEAGDERIKLIKQKNSGVSAARNRGLQEAEGHYCCFVDGDDYLEPDAIETMVRNLEENHAQWLNCQYHRVDAEGNNLGDYSFYVGECDFETQEEKFHFLFDKLLTYQVGYEVWNKLFLLNIIKQNHLKFIEECGMGEDLAFNICYALCVGKVVCIAERCYNYCIRQGSAMSNSDRLVYNLDEYVKFCRGVKQNIARIYPEGELAEGFYLLFSRIMDNVYRKSNLMQITDAALSISCREYYVEQIEAAVRHRKAMQRVYEPGIGKLKWRNCLYISQKLGAGRAWIKCYLWVYRLYRQIRGRERLEEICQN